MNWFESIAVFLVIITIGGGLFVWSVLSPDSMLVAGILVAIIAWVYFWIFYTDEMLKKNCSNDSVFMGVFFMCLINAAGWPLVIALGALTW